MSSGVPILGTVTRPCTVYKTGDKSFSIILTQGLNRQIRRMCEYLGYHVCTLKRIRIMNLTLDGLKCGEYREICGDEWKKLNELIRDSSSETVIRTGGQHGNISGRTNKRTGAEAERSGKGILSGRPGDHEQQRVRRTVRSTGKMERKQESFWQTAQLLMWGMRQSMYCQRKRMSLQCFRWIRLRTETF